MRLVKHVAFLRDRNVSVVNTSFVKASISPKELNRCGAFLESFESLSRKAWFIFLEVQKTRTRIGVLPSCLGQVMWNWPLAIP